MEKTSATGSNRLDRASTGATMFAKEAGINNSASGGKDHSNAETTLFTSASGVFLHASTGERFLDAVSGTFNVSLGYGNPAVLQAMKQVLDTGVIHLSSSFPNATVAGARQALLDVTPPALNHCYTKGSTGGSTAVEQAMRLAWATNGRTSFLTFRGSHHGQTIATSMVSGMPFRKNRIKAQLPVIQVDPPDCYRCAWDQHPGSCSMQCVGAVESALENAPTGKDDITAMIAEPVLGAGGGITPPAAYWPLVRTMLERKGVLLIFDETQTFGRLGTFLAAQHYKVIPDIVTLGKGISGVGMPAAGAVLCTDRVSALGPGESSLTWGGSVLTSAAIRATVEQMRDPAFFVNARETGQYLGRKLREIAAVYPFIGTVRGLGHMTGLEVVRVDGTRAPDSELTNHIIEEAFKQKLILRNSLYGSGSFLKVRPPLVISLAEIDELCFKLNTVLEAI